MGRKLEDLVADYVDKYPNLRVRVDEKTKNPWNLPDWRDASQYPSPDDATYGRWHWEFLRRCEDYRAVWLEYQRNSKEWDRPPYTRLRSPSGRLEYKMEKGGPLTRTEREAARFRIDSLYSPVCRYDLFLDPAYLFPAWSTSPRSDRAAEEVCEVTPAFNGGMTEFCSRAAQKGQFLIALTPTFDLKAQWAYITSEIERLNDEWNDGAAPKVYRWNSRYWQRYLRVLDARDQTTPHSASWEAIAKHFQEEPGTKTAHKDGVRDWYDQAIEVQNKFLVGRPL